MLNYSALLKLSLKPKHIWRLSLVTYAFNSIIQENEESGSLWVWSTYQVAVYIVRLSLNNYLAIIIKEKLVTYEPPIRCNIIAYEICIRENELFKS